MACCVGAVVLANTGTAYADDAGAREPDPAVAPAVADAPPVAAAPPAVAALVPVVSPPAVPDAQPAGPRVQSPLPATTESTLPLSGRPLPIELIPTHESPRLWNWRWRRVQLGDAIATAAGVASAVTGLFLSPGPTIWRGGIGFDDSARAALRLNTVEQRGVAGDVSDLLLAGGLTFPLVVDSLAVAWWFRDSADVAAEMAMIDVEAFAITAGVQGLFVALSNRERPYGSDCGGVVPSNTGSCLDYGRYRSFFSGHTSLSFTGAALTCSHHIVLRLFGGGLPEVVTCAGAVAAATVTGMLRIAADFHYASDVLIGALVGTLVGIGVPLFHYVGVGPAHTGSGNRHAAFSVHMIPTGAGLGLAGTF